ncbi:hypothetical protein VIOLETTEMAD_28 [Bacillus phage VioletteMad]|nr:hypothetical protein VIOLETTEMAD_28 [Bacillus phage VioletteMad]
MYLVSKTKYWFMWVFSMLGISALIFILIRCFDLLF